MKFYGILLGKNSLLRKILTEFPINLSYSGDNLVPKILLYL